MGYKWTRGGKEKIFGPCQMSGIHLVWHYHAFKVKEPDEELFFMGNNLKRKKFDKKRGERLKRLKIRGN